MAFTNWLSRTNRSDRSWTSGVFTIPSGINKVSVRLNLGTNDLFDVPTKTLYITVETADISAGPWVLQYAWSWVGGPTPTTVKAGGDRRTTLDGIAYLAGKLVRARIDQTGTFRYGIQGEII